MDLNKDLNEINYYEHQYETICNSLKNANFDDVTNPEVSANKNKICERTQSINKSNNKNIVNLDCNRIRDHKRLTKILPRPSSLPNSLNNLMKTAFSTKTPETKPTREEIPLNITLIKKLEDEIYKRRELSSGEPKIIWKFGEDCNNTKDISFIKNSSAFNSKNNPVLMIDTWKLDPLLMKYSKDNLILKPPAIASTSLSDGQSILIVDNSKFYPVIMKYEINSSAIENEKPSLLIESQTRCDKIIIPSNRTNINNFLNDEENFIPSTSTSNDDDKNMSKGKISKFKRFIMQRRSLNLSMWKKNSNKIVQENAIKQKPKVKPKNNLNNEKIPPNTLKFIFKEYFNLIEELFSSKSKPNNKNIFWHIKLLSKNCNLNDLFNIYLKEFSINQQSHKFLTKRSKTCIDLTNFSDKIKKCDKNFCWSDSDLNDINKMCLKLEACKIMPMKIIQRPPPLSRNVKFRSSFRLKRHSVGSTDVVKTWVYRRRCLFFLFFI